MYLDICGDTHDQVAAARTIYANLLLYVDERCRQGLQQRCRADGLDDAADGDKRVLWRERDDHAGLQRVAILTDGSIQGFHGDGVGVAENLPGVEHIHLSREYFVAIFALSHGIEQRTCKG